MPGSIGRNGKAAQSALRLLKPGFTSRRKSDIKKYAEEYCEQMIDILVRIAADDEVFPRDRILAAETVLNRAYGKPGQAMLEDSFDATIVPEKLPTSELTRMLQELKEDGVVVDDALLSLPEPVKQEEATNVD